MRRRDFLKSAACWGLAAWGLTGCSLNKISADVGIPRESLPTPVNMPAGYPDLAIVSGFDSNELLDKGFSAMGGIGNFVKSGQTVVIKPNFSVPRTPEHAATTSAVLVGALVRRCFAAGAAEVKVIDHTFTSGQMCLEASGIRREVEAAGGAAYVINTLNTKFYQQVDLGGSILRANHYSRDVLEADVFISFPILKHHSGTQLTMGLKNMMGLVWDRGIFHSTDLHRTIAENAAFKKPHLIILDATRGITANGPMGPGPIREYNQVVFSRDPVAVDAYGAKLFGIDPAEIPYIRIAAELGVGRADWEKLNVVRV